MITAFKEGTRELIFPTRGINGFCPYCEKPLITKCGNINRHHFAHKPGADCDSDKYHDGISAWHIDWQFTINNPIAGVNVEVPLNNEEYQKRADLVTPTGVIIEFQKSPLPIEERLLREKHYKKMIWVVHEDRFNSKTWKDEVGNQPVFFDLSGSLYCRNERFSITKNKFIRSIINCRFFSEHAWSVIKERGSRPEKKDIFEIYWHLILDHDENVVGRAIDCNLIEFCRIEKERIRIEKERFRIEKERKKRLDEEFHGGLQRFQCPKCNLWYYSFDAFEKHKKKCF